MSRLRCGQSGGLVAALVLGATAFAAPSPRVALRWQAALPVAPATRAALEAPVPRSPATDGVYKVRSIEEPVTFAWTLPEGAQGVLFELSATEDGFDAPTLQQEVEGEHLVLRPDALLAHAEQGRDAVREQLAVAFGGQVGEPGAVGQAAGPRGLDREPGLADPGGSGHGHERVVPEQPPELGELGRPSDDAADLRGQVATPP